MKLDDKTLEKGSVLYRRHCLHCHGMTGDGHGATAAWVNPHPRDYRAGIFKFISSERKARRDDLLRTLRQGVEGTSMPSFGLLEPEELEALASTVIHLSLRGETEIWTIKALQRRGPRKGEGDDGTYSVGREVQVWANGFAGQWRDADATGLEVKAYAVDAASARRSVKRGHR